MSACLHGPVVLFYHFHKIEKQNCFCLTFQGHVAGALDSEKFHFRWLRKHHCHGNESELYRYDKEHMICTISLYLTILFENDPYFLKKPADHLIVESG